MKTIIKRNLTEVPYDAEKIRVAIRKSFVSVGEECDSERLDSLIEQIEMRFHGVEMAEVEEIQDAVEVVLMKNDCYDVAKSYILYREKRTSLRRIRSKLIKDVGDEGLERIFHKIQRDFQDYDLSRLRAKYIAMNKDEMDLDSRLKLLTKSAEELTSQEEPNWEKIAGRVLSYVFHRELAETEENLSISGFYNKIKYLTDEGLYGQYILENYDKNEIDQIAAKIDNTRNDLFTYSGLDLLIHRYIIHNHSHVSLESPQEMFMGVAMHLAMGEKVDRLFWVEKFYDILSLQKVTMATPTLSNARKPYNQLSSCFIDTVPDSLEGIYHSISQFAEVSKLGGGMGMYFGKVRSRGGKIRGFEGASGGVIRWIRLVNDTAVAVDQLGMRQGAVAVYLDAWHKDLPEFLQLRTNNGDDRMKAHDVFPAVCYPDLFWKMAKENLDQDWYLMDPHDILTTKGYSLEDSYGEEWEEKYLDCVNDSRISKRAINLKELVRLILKSAVETGTPFAFYRDTVNRANPNKHQGMIYCSNLCTEIAQNMSETEFLSKTITTEDGDQVVVQTTKPGDFVVCNLASLCLGHIDVSNKEELEDVTATTVRALDNVIDLNLYPVPYAEITSKRNRAIGLGVSGYHHMLAKNKIRWESEEHVAFADRVFEDIAYAAIKASNELAKERGSYSYFKGSEWETGEYFVRRNYDSDRWLALKDSIKEGGMRNGWLMATAPTSSTSILIGTSAGLDPVMSKFYLEEKKGMIMPRVAPDLSTETFWYYKQAHYIDQTWSIKAAGARQRHIDQAQSMNFWINNDYKMSQLLNLYILAWEEGVKTVYYVRSKSLEAEECDSCSA